MKYKILKSQCLPGGYFSVGYDTFRKKKYIFPMWIEVDASTTKEDVVVINDVAKVSLPTSTKVLQVAGSKGNVYTVTISPKGNSCTCIGFEFRGNCKHIKNAITS